MVATNSCLASKSSQADPNLHLWSKKIFKEIRDYCGGWIQTEEETELRNHSKWARVKVKGDGSDVPKSVKVECDDVVSEIQVWCEAPVRTTIVAPNGENTTDRWTIGVSEGSKGGAQRGSRMWEHVGCSDIRDFPRLEQSRELACGPNLNLNKSQKRARPSKKLGPDLLAQSIPVSSDVKACDLVFRTDPLMEELTANALRQREKLHIEKLATVLTTTTLEIERKEANTDLQSPLEQEKSLIIADNTEEYTGETQMHRDSEMQTQGTNKAVGWAIEEPIPLNSSILEEEKDLEFEASIWVHQNVLKLSREFGLACNGHKKEAFELFMKIDEKDKPVVKIMAASTYFL